MPAYSEKSQAKLRTCDDRLRLVFNEVIKHFDNTILCGFRDYTEQTEAYRNGRSRLRWDYSKHNKFPSMAVDVAPYPINWKDFDRFRYFAGFVMGIAVSFSIRLRWGGDWNNDTEVKDNRFNDLSHFELIL